MAVTALTHEDLLLEWDWCWAAQDAEAAAELGRTLLERNRELEATIRQQQAVLDDQAQEMQYLVKQNTLLRQAAESRLRLCEQLEAAAAEMDRAKSRLVSDLHSERQRYHVIKSNLEAAEERCNELQRLLDQSRSSETQTRTVLRTLQQQQQQERQHREECMEHVTALDKPNPPNAQQPNEAVCRLVENLAELEERVHSLEMELLDEKRKKQQLELENCALLQENKALEQQHDEQLSASSFQQKKGRSLSLGEELLLSSDDFASLQWREAWDHSGPLSLIGSVLVEDPEDRRPQNLKHMEKNRNAKYSEESSEEVSSELDMDFEGTWASQKKKKSAIPAKQDRGKRYVPKALCDAKESVRNSRFPRSLAARRRNDEDSLSSESRITENEDSYSSSSGFSEENRLRSTPTEASDNSCRFPCSYCRTLQNQKIIELSSDSTLTGLNVLSDESGKETDSKTSSDGNSDYKQLFQEIFAVLKQNL